jgi:hypothetical protein
MTSLGLSRSRPNGCLEAVRVDCLRLINRPNGKCVGIVVYRGKSARWYRSILRAFGRIMTPAEAKYPASLQNIPLDERQLTLLKQPATVLHLLDPTTPIPDAFRSYLLETGAEASGSEQRRFRINQYASRGQKSGCTI